VPYPASPVSVAQAFSEGRALSQNPRPERRELDHRMANSLQLAADLLLFEQARVRDPDAREALGAAVARLSAVAQLHRCLCDHDQASGVDLKLFLGEICDLIAQSTGLACSLDADPVVLAPATAQQLAIAINELAMNAAKHAYRGRMDGKTRGALHVEARCTGDRLRLTVSDHGAGLGEGFQIGQATGLGMDILQAIVRQVRGTLEAQDDHGARFTITLPLPRIASSSRSFAPPA
jgi:two-component sensor histidine kinase